MITVGTKFADFKALVESTGGILLETEWLGSETGHRCICAAYHRCAPTPAKVRAGHGICRTCAGMAWDHFYVVVNRSDRRVKFGITSGNPGRRLAVHRREGYLDVVRSVRVPSAERLERACISTLSDAGFVPISGREYFDLPGVAVVLEVVDHWSIPRDSPKTTGPLPWDLCDRAVKRAALVEHLQHERRNSNVRATAIVRSAVGVSEFGRPSEATVWRVWRDLP